MIVLLGMFPLLSGCSSFGKGVAQAILERETADTRLCEITGPGFPGVQASIDQQAQGKHHTKVLMIHGIGGPQPGYSARFREKLVRELNLDSMDQTVRNIEMVNAENKGESVGLLKIFRFFSSARNDELIFYELTWSGLTEEGKKVIAFDNSEAYGYRRATINKSLKSFMNESVPDLLVYEGPERERINKSVGQSVCWMFKSEWNDLPTAGPHYCNVMDNDIAENIKQDDYFVVTHSLGSRITIDTFNRFAQIRQNCTDCGKHEKLNKAMQDETFTVFMLANQLPLLQVGRPKPADASETDKYCLPSGTFYNKRLIGKTRIVAFSDPNDILSYPIPPDYADTYIDSRMCPEVVNVDINIAKTTSVLGLDFANPLEAHSGYHEDERVIKIISKGLARNHLDPLLADRCHWTETVR